jgi:nucleoside-diphosphate-sugar epimerase
MVGNNLATPHASWPGVGRTNHHDPDPLSRLAAVCRGHLREEKRSQSGEKDRTKPLPNPARQENIKLRSPFVTMATGSETILITGAAGFIGQRLTAALLEKHPQYRLVITDIVAPAIPLAPGVQNAEKAVPIQADLSDPASLASLIAASQPLKAVFVFHGIMSSGSEADPTLSLKVNLDATRALLLKLSETNKGVRVVYASSQAVYGSPLPDVITDAVTPTPAGVYGTHKLMTEVFINDLHRRGLIDAFSLRFPTISVRAGKPTQAASSFLSGIIREPMNDQECVVPIKDRGYRAVLSGPGTLVENLLRILHLPSDALPPHIRWMNFPGISVTVQQLLDALAKVGGEDRLKYVKEEPDVELERILRSWPRKVDDSTAMNLGLKRDESVEGLVREYAQSIGK